MKCFKNKNAIKCFARLIYLYDDNDILFIYVAITLIFISNISVFNYIKFVEEWD